MNQPINLAIHGASGRMGRALLALAAADPRFALQAAIVGVDSTRVGQDTGHGPRFASRWGEQTPDLVIDFSTPAGLATVLERCQANGLALVTGTTGLDAALEQRLRVASEHIAILHASNFSLGVAVLTRLLRAAAAALPDWDLEIIEAHHAGKRDAPSGTAWGLGQAAAAARGVDLDVAAIRARNGLDDARPHGGIGFASVRAADIIGEHTALLATSGERLELTHRATDRDIFARGALAAAAWLVGQEAGLYGIENLLDQPWGTPD